ncbi:hypothetical protein ACJ41O_006025 [Fusarium nematophilum]
MPKLIQVRTKTGEVLDNNVITSIVEGTDGAEFLPSPLIFPPMYMIKGPEELAKTLREKLGDNATVEVLQDMED